MLIILHCYLVFSYIYISNEQKSQVTKLNQDSDSDDSGDSVRAGTATMPIADDNDSKQSSESGAAN